MRTLIVALLVCLTATSTAQAQKEESKLDVEKIYQALLKNRPDIRKKVESGNASKADIINWIKKNADKFAKAGNAPARKGSDKKVASKKPTKKLNVDAFNKKLTDLTKSGKLSGKEAAALQAIVKGKAAGKGGKGQSNGNFDLDKFGEELKEAVKNGKMTREDAIRKYQAVARKLKGGAKGKGGKGKGGKGKGGKGKRGDGKGAGFYAIVIGRLKSKDIELGEFTLAVDHATSMYGNRWVKDKIVGKTVKVTGVSGTFRDQLLLIKRGQTLKFRSGAFIEDENTLTFGMKFHVLERAKPFEPEAYGVPHADFRGFAGTLEGKIIEHGGYELVMQIEKIDEADGSKAKNAQVGKGKLIRMTGFFTVAKQYDDLTKGDRIRVNVRHNSPTFDEFAYASDLVKVK